MSLKESRAPSAYASWLDSVAISEESSVWRVAAQRVLSDEVKACWCSLVAVSVFHTVKECDGGS
jgi:hypothetical protein